MNVDAAIGPNGQADTGAAGPSKGAEFLHGFCAFLTSESILDADTIDRARRAAGSTAERIDRVLTKLGLLAEADLATALARYLHISLVTPGDIPAEPLLTDLASPDFVRRNKVMPLVVTDETITLGVTDPFADEPVRALAYLTNCAPAIALFTPADFDKVFKQLYSSSPIAPNAGGHAARDASEADIQRLRDLASEAPTIRLVNQIIAAAVEARASDIHIEPNIDAMLVRYRIDGALRTAQRLDLGQRAAVTSRIKIMSSLDIAERRLPQDGRIKIAVRGVDIDLRISTIPTAFGESVVMRILDRSRVELDFAKLGFPSPLIEDMQRLLHEPNGIILVTGPTGSGKTTTLYTALSGLNSAERKLFTVEDPIEYQLDRINQIQVQPAIGLDFPRALRSILRQDPDVIMIGEIRDLETARIAIQASLTGHLVFSTLHTNSAAASITRLIDMGVENYLLASTVKGVLAQRLVRRLCPHCSQPHEKAEHWRDAFGKAVSKIRPLGEANIRQATGCPECGQSGFSGRTTLAELLLISGTIHGLVLSAASDAQIEAAARNEGMAGMYEDGITKVWRGETTIEEVLRATRVV